MPLLYYWRGDNYRRDLDLGAGYHLNQGTPRLHEALGSQPASQKELPEPSGQTPEPSGWLPETLGRLPGPWPYSVWVLQGGRSSEGIGGKNHPSCSCGRISLV